MASEEQLALSGLIKSVHQRLRDSSKETPPDQVWREHLQNEDLLRRYAVAMHTLATCYWDKTMEVSCKKDNSRIEWVVMKALDENFNYQHHPYEISRVRLLDVGSCYNPFSKFADFEVTAIDIAPAHESVKYCDFLEVPLCQSLTTDPKPSSIDSLPLGYFDAVAFCLLLEYMPSSDQRLLCCQKAYDVLKPEGILLVITPDSRHQGANAKLMKNWRFTLGLMGFTRIKIEKLEHVTCMVFRKSIFKEVSERWCRIHKEDYMTPVLNIPQDFNNDTMSNADDVQGEHVEKSVEDMVEIREMFGGLPFVDDEMN
ncbi:hypothetical protein RP20_CCG021900 [Aedes albopictus]|nr:hypothetical protein RP20_CCG021900 [Aedes albopictus]